MIATAELEGTVEEVQARADDYVAEVLGQTYFTKNGELQEDGWYFTVKCHREDMKRTPAVGYLIVCEDGQVKHLSEDYIREMKEAAETQAAKERGEEFARDEDGHVLRRHARIKAGSWLANYVDHKIGARGGIFIPIEPPIWRFSVCDFLRDSEPYPLDVIDVNAVTGEVYKPTQDQINIIIRGVCAARKRKKQTTTW